MLSNIRVVNVFGEGIYIEVFTVFKIGLQTGNLLCLRFGFIVQSIWAFLWFFIIFIKIFLIVVLQIGAILNPIIGLFLSLSFSRGSGLRLFKNDVVSAHLMTFYNLC